MGEADGAGQGGAHLCVYAQACQGLSGRAACVHGRGAHAPFSDGLPSLRPYLCAWGRAGQRGRRARAQAHPRYETMRTLQRIET